MIWATTWENRIFAYAKTKTQISFAAKLISAFVFATRLVPSLYLLNSKFQASSSILWLYSPVCVGPGQKPQRPVFWRRGSFVDNDVVIEDQVHNVKTAFRLCLLWKASWNEPQREKTNVEDSDQVWNKPGCTAKEDGKRLEILFLGSRGIVLCK